MPTIGRSSASACLRGRRCSSRITSTREPDPGRCDPRDEAICRSRRLPRTFRSRGCGPACSKRGTSARARERSRRSGRVFAFARPRVSRKPNQRFTERSRPSARPYSSGYGSTRVEPTLGPLSPRACSSWRNPPPCKQPCCSPSTAITKTAIVWRTRGRSDSGQAVRVARSLPPRRGTIRDGEARVRASAAPRSARARCQAGASIALAVTRPAERGHRLPDAQSATLVRRTRPSTR